MNLRRCTCALLAWTALGGPVSAQQEEPGVASLVEAHDRSLLADLKEYIRAKPEAADLDQAYLIVFEKAIENDWFVENEEQARRYLETQPDGAVAPMARIVSTMARADASEFDQALADYEALLGGLGQPEQEEFAANFADSLARKAIATGRVDVARRVFEGLSRRYGDSPTLRQRVEDEIRRLDRVGKPAPELIVRDLAGDTLRLSDLRGKVVLVDFWATWCAPCLEQLPAMSAAYEKFRSRGFEIVGVSLDETVQPLADFLRQREIPWKQVHGATSGGDPVAAFGITSIPASFLVAPDGTIVRLDPRGADLEGLLEELVP